MRIRYFAAARAAAGVDEEVVDVPAGASVSDIARLLGERHPDLVTVLRRCSYLLDEVAVRDVNAQANGVMIDVLPPFAGG
ncbi:ThiamineS protein OS=Tsukamurella paurometabola (strain ATCC 8368 / DSM / CCUG 35730 / CIP 100753/ JCM 10117 / KCTC 9821 / NBRC 16120 / NCIMB 702349 /NCTC 13040) OX=521096 GN=Tpau_0822 PE=4 SV=1 [Tsukamurella paurometabola]|uniref:ThiamineS protein n=1 Tax=Tsukamurella paurometabola (strain ATCC 8368 / DSM 20162 / CCUG 35730 / CIP 100753 / JCM 10117 / KCTC 9821 / NBRC 16120 / NCIMB 702349 / NCTC 13040) TaxID=521096 RepID=D5UTV4_TSUPD|nr:MoaD/ThiS family protein [Tsukamurella paurometabola]ADG77458.1 thiamineS protein [Tsukamurella paurometabola DSM 20162]SUP27130.1 molybdopterin converting factor, subunit 1 [Tsukamurella paurometabola]